MGRSICFYSGGRGAQPHHYMYWTFSETEGMWGEVELTPRPKLRGGMEAVAGSLHSHRLVDQQSQKTLTKKRLKHNNFVDASRVFFSCYSHVHMESDVPTRPPHLLDFVERLLPLSKHHVFCRPPNPRCLLGSPDIQPCICEWEIAIRQDQKRVSDYYVRPTFSEMI